jgi:hypothetical protein
MSVNTASLHILSGCGYGCRLGQTALRGLTDLNVLLTSVSVSLLCVKRSVKCLVYPPETLLPQAIINTDIFMLIFESSSSSVNKCIESGLASTGYLVLLIIICCLSFF